MKNQEMVKYRNNPEDTEFANDLLYRKIVEGVSDLVFVSSMDHIIEYMNPAMIERTGYDATGEQCFKVLNGLDEPCPSCDNEIIRKGESHRFEFTSPKDGHVYNTLNVPLLNAYGDMVKVSIMRDITERRKIEDDLREEKILIEGLINSLPGIFVLINEFMRFVRWNRNLEVVTGYSAKEIAEMSLTDFFEGREKKLIESMVRNVMDCVCTSAECQVVSKDGVKIPYFFTGSRISINDEQHMILSGIDILERFEIEEMLRKLSMAVEQSSSSIVITDSEGKIEYANPSFQKMTGYDLEEVIGRYTDKFPAILPVSEDGRESWQFIAEAGNWPLELRNKRKNGELFWESVSISPIKNPDNITTHYLSVTEDITARKSAERELLKSRAELLVQHEKLKDLFDQVELSKKEWENTMDCIMGVVLLVNSEGNIKRFNKALLDLTGKTFHYITGRNWHDLFTEHGFPIPSAGVQEAELCHEPSGKWFSFNSFPFTDNTRNEYSGTVITLYDVTEAKRFTRELEKACSDLKTTQAKVIQQEKMASIGQLAAGVAHEINNPMGFISSNLNTLGKYVDRLNEFIAAQSELIESMADNEAAEALRKKRKTLKLDYILEDGIELIRESLDGAERVRTIVQNLKSFSRVDQAECKHADINECIASTINIVWNELKYKAKLNKDLGDIPLTKCFPQQLNQVFMNLLVNAAQAIKEQGVIDVRTWHENGSIMASVSDTGCGMGPAVLNRIFEPFFTTKEVGKGTGLGLSITYDIVKNHNGDITVESEPGKGTTFTVRIPVMDGNEKVNR
jgi:two-component system NtrC family sensor kinase